MQTMLKQRAETIASHIVSRLALYKGLKNMAQVPLTNPFRIKMVQGKSTIQNKEPGNVIRGYKVYLDARTFHSRVQ